jgi:hypothetical protein
MTDRQIPFFFTESVWPSSEREKWCEMAGRKVELDGGWREVDISTRGKGVKQRAPPQLIPPPTPTSNSYQKAIRRHPI